MKDELHADRLGVATIDIVDWCRNNVNDSAPNRTKWNQNQNQWFTAWL